MSNKHSTKSVTDRLHSLKSIENQKNKDKVNKNNMERKLQKYISASQSASTKRAYASDLRHFLAHGGCVPCTPRRLANYLAESANNGLAVATLERRVTAIHQAHLDRHHPSPTCAEVVRQVLQGIRRTLGTRPRQAKPLQKDDLLAALEAIKINCMPVRAARDRALLLIGFASAMRRSELVGVCLEDLIFSDLGLEIDLPFSKTDQQGCGRTVFIPSASGIHCPVKALKYWIRLSGIRRGYVFRAVNRFEKISQSGLTAQSVSLILKAAMVKAGMDARSISGHSFRAGYCTTAAEEGWQSWQIREQTGHKSEVILAKYIRISTRKKSPSLL